MYLIDLKVIAMRPLNFHIAFDLGFTPPATIIIYLSHILDLSVFIINVDVEFILIVRCWWIGHSHGPFLC